MPRALLCLSIVAAFSLRISAADTVGLAVPVPAATVTLLQEHGLSIEREPARFLASLTRLLHGGIENRTAVIEALRRSLAAHEPVRDVAFVVALPFGPATWTRTILKRAVPLDALVSAIAIDRKAALLLHGLEGVDDETLAFLGEHPALLTELYERRAPVFAAFAGSVRVRANRIVPPGDAAAGPAWEALVGVPVSEPERFLSLLFGLHEGRIAYLYDTLAHLEAPHAAFALSAGAPPPVRLARLQALADVAIHQFGDWKPAVRPFSRPVHDLALTLVRAKTDPSGAFAPPADRRFWNAAFDLPLDAGHPPAGTASRAASTQVDAATTESPASDDAVDAAWLVRAICQGTMAQRGDRIDQVAFAQRVFGSVTAEERTDAIEAVRAFPSYRTLMLTLERVGVRRAGAFVAAVRHAARVSLGDGSHSFWQVAQLQSALALVARMRDVDSIDMPTTEALIASLVSTALDEHGRYAGALAEWVSRELLPRLPVGDTAEARVMIALAGRLGGESAPRIVWEGQAYRVDPAFAESRRLHAVRQKLGGYTIDLGLALDAVADQVSGSATADDLSRAVASLTAVRDRFGHELDRLADVLPSGVDSQRPAREAIERLLAELSGAARTKDVRRAARIAAALAGLVDVVLGEALLTMAYAADIGRPDGPALLARNVALRHDFGLSRHGDDRIRMAWALPRQDFQPGVPWHVAGSALGLDVALARLSLNRTGGERPLGAPKLSSLDRDGFAVGAALMRPGRMRDTELAAVREAIERGRRRLTAMALRTGTETFADIATELGMDGWRRRAVHRALADDARRAEDLFSLAEMLMLGAAPADLDVHLWGSGAIQTAGCLCTRVVLPRSWRLLAGRNQLALGAAAVPDLHLRIAVMLAELGLPASLARPVLAGAIDDFVAEVEPTDMNDWWALAHAAARVSRERVEDYVASAASVDGALVPEDAADSR